MEPVSGKHSGSTHFPKDPKYDICLKTKITRASCRRRAGTVVPRAENVGDKYAGGIWKGDIMVADIEELEEMDASELHARRLNAKEVLTPQRSGKFTFPVADGTV